HRRLRTRLATGGPGRRRHSPPPRPRGITRVVLPPWWDCCTLVGAAKAAMPSPLNPNRIPKRIEPATPNQARPCRIRHDVARGSLPVDAIPDHAIVEAGHPRGSV